MSIKLTEEQVEVRNAYVLEEFKRNPKIGMSTMKKLTREKFGAGIGFYHARELKKQAKAERRTANGSVKASLKKGTKPVNTSMAQVTPLFKELADSLTESFGDCHVSLERKDGNITADVRTSFFKARFELPKE